MNIVERLTPAHYKVRSLQIEQDESGEIQVVGNLAILNAEGETIAQDMPSVILSAAERQTLLSFVQSKLADYEQATGLTYYVEP